ncbi:peptidoglycan DD-metalloendopeptidase family protein [Candidatus Nomurabacteria bacterium]|nr:peptidoglycan DD-metalloendopeptidase family protein [Candidatus Nomurabacteria bacterium]
MRRIFWLFLVLIIFGPFLVHADQATELQAQIRARQNEIGKLDAQIAAQEKTLGETTKQANTLENTLKTIDLTIGKLNNQITRTEKEISATKLKIDELNLNIKKTGGNIERNEDLLRELLRDLSDMNRESLLMILVSYKHFSDLWQASDQLVDLQRGVHSAAEELRKLKGNLSVEVTTTEKEQAKLLRLQRELSDQKKIIATERSKQNNLLAQTKSSEANYKKLLEESRQRREDFAKELNEFESQLKFALDPNKLPVVRQGILAWPLDGRLITQLFGKTSDAKRLYASGTHNGIDFRASVGTVIKSAEAGIVAGTGDTDLTCRGASYGRWVLIKHDNGLATLYAHLSLIKVSANQRVSRGELIGYSGATGYATGPHLHFTVAAGDGVEIKSLKSKVCPGSYVMPIFDTRAYLDPVLYL